MAPNSTSSNLGYVELTILKLDEFIDKSSISKIVLRYSSIHLYYNVTSHSTSYSKVTNGGSLSWGDATSLSTKQLKTCFGHQNRDY